MKDYINKLKEEYRDLDKESVLVVTVATKGDTNFHVAFEVNKDELEDVTQTKVETWLKNTNNAFKKSGIKPILTIVWTKDSLDFFLPTQSEWFRTFLSRDN
jgi:hypothetical protein